jgi:alpha-beta hydrolase superfamily lysophospholipase
MSLDKLAVTHSGRMLYGVTESPERPPVGGIVLVHGWGGCRVGPHRMLVEMARELAAQGFVALRFDLTGRGESAGDPLASDLDAMIDDACAALDVLRSRLAPGTPLGLLGMCSGGNVALGAAALRDDVRAVVAWSTYPFQEQRSAAQDVKRTGHMAGSYLRKALRPETWRKLLAGRVNWGRVGRALAGHYRSGDGSERDLQRSRRDILAGLARYRGHVLFLYGSADPEAADAEQVFRAFCEEHGIPAEFAFVEGANHNFYSLEWKRQAIRRTAGWVAGLLAG